ncbi:MAG: hypothetical protein ACRENN_02215 [Candidatus Eiseniibacteriota bacterium]
MDKHEKGLEKNPDRLDQSLPDWAGGYGGSPKRLPKVVQKLLLGRALSAEEKAELLWRFYELDQGARARTARDRRMVAVVALLLAVVYVAVFQRAWVVASLMAWLSPPASG